MDNLLGWNGAFLRAARATYVSRQLHSIQGRFGSPVSQISADSLGGYRGQMSSALQNDSGNAEKSAAEGGHERKAIHNLDSLRTMVGQEFISQHWLKIDQQRIQTFAGVTDDNQWIHLDVERASLESPYKTTVAHGFLTLSLISHFMNDAVEVRGSGFFVINYGLDRVRFPAPVRAGEEIRARFLLRSVTEIAGGLQAVYLTTIEIKGSPKPCCVAEWLVRYYTT